MPENKEFYSRYGRPCDYADYTVNILVHRPGSMYDPERLLWEDENAARTIDELEGYLQQLKQHRQAIAERYQELATSPTVPVIRLERARRDKVKFYLREFRQYADGKRLEISTKIYSGKQRHEAIAAYKAYVKSHPGIVAELDIEKGRWER